MRGLWAPQTLQVRTGQQFHDLAGFEKRVSLPKTATLLVGG